MEKYQVEASTAHDCSKVVISNCLERVKHEIVQLLRTVDQRLNRIIRRHSRIMKCDKRNSKLEEFEGTVDGVVDWIYDAEATVSSAIEGTFQVVKERTDKLEVTTLSLPSLFCRYLRKKLTFLERPRVLPSKCTIPNVFVGSCQNSVGNS